MRERRLTWHDPGVCQLGQSTPREKCMEDRIQDRRVDRRRLLRRAGTVAAGVAGAGVAGAVVAPPAQAGVDDIFTGTTAEIPGATFVNTHVGDDEGWVTVGPQLKLEPAGEILDPAAPNGSVAMDADGYIWVAANGYRDFVHTTANSNLTVPVTPSRATDTGTTQRSAFINASTALTGNYLKAKTWAYLDLTNFVAWGTGAFITLQAVTPATAGYISVGPFVGETTLKPNWSNLNFGTGASVSGMTFTGIGGDGETYPSDLIAIYSSVQVRLIVDITAFVVDSRGRVNPAISSAGFAASGPSFYEKRLAQIAKQRQA
jgi:hypothetical protein